MTAAEEAGKEEAYCELGGARHDVACAVRWMMEVWGVWG